MRAPTKATTPARTIDEYLGAVRSDQRAALERLRKTIRAAAPGVEEWSRPRSPEAGGSRS